MARVVGSCTKAILARGLWWGLFTGVIGSGCALIGYDPVGMDGGPGDGSRGVGLAEEWDGGVEVEPSVDTGVLVPVASDGGDRHDAASTTDAGTSVLDASSDATLDSQSTDAEVRLDASSSGDAASVCVGSENACGGCDPLAAAVGGWCGVCGLGRQACVGQDDLVCSEGGATPVGRGGPLLIDDFEDGDGLLDSPGTFSGLWYTTDDGTGGVVRPAPSETFVPSVVGGFGGSNYCAHFSVGGFVDWGAAMAVQLNSFGCLFDASAQQGLELHARGTGTIRVSLATFGTTSLAEGGSCIDRCFDHFGVNVTLSPVWTRYRFQWSDFLQSGWGAAVPRRPSQLRYIEFSVGPNAVTDFYLDDLAFY